MSINIDEFTERLAAESRCSQHGNADTLAFVRVAEANLAHQKLFGRLGFHNPEAYKAARAALTGAYTNMLSVTVNVAEAMEQADELAADFESRADVIAAQFTAHAARHARPASFARQTARTV